MPTTIVFKNVDYNDGDEDTDERSTLEDLSRAPKKGHIQGSMTANSYNYKSAYDKIINRIPPITIIIIIIPGCCGKDDSYV